MIHRKSCAACLTVSILFFLLLFGEALFAQSPKGCPQNAKDVLKDAKQLLVFTGVDWNSKSAVFRRYERKEVDQVWTPVDASTPAVLGSKGLAWGYPYRTFASGSRNAKREGDGRTPAGIYRLGRPFGLGASKIANWIELRDSIECVDDAASKYYNQIVDIASPTFKGPRDWKSSEKMAAEKTQPIYKAGIEVDYPSDAKSKAGSCIFVHVWRSADKGTAGCGALMEGTVRSVQTWLDPNLKPAVAFLPADALLDREGWGACLPGAAPDKRESEIGPKGAGQ